MTYYAIEPPKPWANIEGRPYITVSAKGIANGLSDIPNDGADFGPDTPGTQTMGIQEAWDYASANGYKVMMIGNFYISVPLILRSTYINMVIEGTNGNGSKNGTQIYLADNFDTSYQYMLDYEIQGNLIWNNIRLTPFNKSGSIKLNYLMQMNATHNSNSSSYFMNGTWDAPTIAQIYQAGTVDGRIEWENIIFNGGGQYIIYSTYPNSYFTFYECSLNNPIFISINNGTWNGEFIHCNGPYLHSNSSAINITGGTAGPVRLRFIGDGPILWGTAQIGNNVNIYVTNGRIAQYKSANFFNVQGTNFRLYLEDGYINMNAGTSGNTYYLVTGSSSSSGFVELKNIEGSNISGVTLLPTNSSSIPVLIKHSTQSTMPDGLYPTASIAGTTAGTVSISGSEYGTISKKYIITFSGYENSTTTNQTINFPIPFSSYAVITANNTGLTISTSTTGITITSPNNTTTYSGIVIVEGY